MNHRAKCGSTLRTMHGLRKSMFCAQHNTYVYMIQHSYSENVPSSSSTVSLDIHTCTTGSSYSTRHTQCLQENASCSSCGGRSKSGPCTVNTVGVKIYRFPHSIRATEWPFPFHSCSITRQFMCDFRSNEKTVPVLCLLFACFICSLTQIRESTTRCLQRIQGHRASTITKLVEGEGTIASRRDITKLHSLTDATILGQGKLAVESWQKQLTVFCFRAAHNAIVLQQNCPRHW